LISNRNDGSGGGTIGGDAVVSLSAASISVGGELLADVSTNSGGTDHRSAVDINTPGDFMTQGNLDIEIENAGFNVGSVFLRGGTVQTDAVINVSASNISTANGYFNTVIANDGGGHIGGSATINVMASNAFNTGGDAYFDISNSPNGTGTPAGTIGSDAIITLSANSASIGGLLQMLIDNSGGGNIGGNALINFGVPGDVNIAGDASFQILNNAGTIGGDATIGVVAANISVGTPLAPANLGVFIDNNSGTIGGSVATNLNVSGDITVAGAINAFLNNGGATSSPGSHITGDATINVLGATGINAGNGAFFAIVNEDAGAGTFGGTIDGNALVRVTADHLSTEALAPSDFNLFGTIHNSGGSIVGNSDVTFDIAGAITTAGTASFDTLNFDDGGPNGGGIIGGDARVSINAGALSIGGDLLLVKIINEGGAIGGNAVINADVSGAISTQGEADFQIFNENNGSGGGSIGLDATINVSATNISTGGSLFAEIFNSSGGMGSIGGSIGGGAMIDVAAANITANSLVAQIDNTGGSIGASTEAGAMINMNISNSATVTNDATVAIYGSDGAVGGAGININGGNYNVGGTFLTYIDGNGAITFNNASMHADVLKAGVFGNNGTLRVGGGTLSANTTLELYAPGSNGQLNFVSNVTLGGNSIKILAANSVTIFNNVVVTIGGPNPADVYTGFTGEIPNANYTGFGGNGTTTGTFAGAGANRPRPLSDAPPFGAPAPGNPTNGKRSKTVINIPNSGQLLSLLDGAVPGRDGRLTVPRHKQRHAANADRLNVNRMIKADRDMADVRHMRDRGVINNRLGSGARAF
jgi:hypothetical protein